MRVLSPFRFTLVTLGGAVLIGSTFLLWTLLADGVVFGALDQLEALERTGWDQAPVLSAVLAVLGALLIALGVLGGRRQISRRVDLRLAVLVVAAAVAVGVAGFETERITVPTQQGGRATVAQAMGGPGALGRPRGRRTRAGRPRHPAREGV